MSHHRNDPELIAKKAKIDTYQVQLLAYFLEQAARRRPTATVRCSITASLLYGGGMGDGNLHRHSDLPCLLAGKLGGQFKTGRHLAYPENTPMSNLLLTILASVGRAAGEARRQHRQARTGLPVHRLTGIARCDPAHRAGTAGLWLKPDAAAAFNGLSHRLTYCAICVPGYPDSTDRIIVNAALRACGPHLWGHAVRPRRDGSLRATPVSQWQRGGDPRRTLPTRCPF